MEIGALLILILLVIGLGLWVAAYFNKSHGNSIIWILVKLCLKLLFMSLLVPLTVVFFLKEHVVFVLYAFNIVGILFISSLTLFLNLISAIRKNELLSAISFFVLPMAISLYGLRFFRGAFDSREFKIVAFTSTGFFLIELYCFIQFRRRLFYDKD